MTMTPVAPVRKGAATHAVPARQVAKRFAKRADTTPFACGGLTSAPTRFRVIPAGAAPAKAPPAAPGPRAPKAAPLTPPATPG